MSKQLYINEYTLTVVLDATEPQKAIAIFQLRWSSPYFLYFSWQFSEVNKFNNSSLLHNCSITPIHLFYWNNGNNPLTVGMLVTPNTLRNPPPPPRSVCCISPPSRHSLDNPPFWTAFWGQWTRAWQAVLGSAETVTNVNIMEEKSNGQNVSNDSPERQRAFVVTRELQKWMFCAGFSLGKREGSGWCWDFHLISGWGLRNTAWVRQRGELGTVMEHQHGPRK